MLVSKRKEVTLKALMERNLNLTIHQVGLLNEMTRKGIDHREQIEKTQDEIQAGMDAIQDEIDEGYCDENIDTSIIFVERVNRFEEE